MMTRLLVLAMLAAIVPSPASAQWGTGSCASSAQWSPVVIDQRPVDQWVKVSGTAHQWAWLHNGRHVGSWDSDGVYRSYDSASGVWGTVEAQTPANAPALPLEAQKIERKPAPEPIVKPVTKPAPTGQAACDPNSCPCGKGCRCAETGQDCLGTGHPCFPMGLTQTMLSLAPTLWLGANHVPAELIQGEGLPDLSGKGYVTVIAADQAKREKIVDEILASTWAKNWRVQGKDPLHWHMEPFKLGDDATFKTTGLKVIAQKAPDAPGGFGKEILAQYEWAGAEEFGRKIDPAYNPNKPVEPTSGSVPLWWFVAGGLGLMLFIPGGRQE